MLCSCGKNNCLTHKPLVVTHLHSDFSQLDGCGRIEDYIKLAKEYNHPAIALTDHGTMSGTLEFYKKCKENDLKAIIGSEMYLNDFPQERPNKSDADSIDNSRSNSHQIILVKNQQGYKNLNKLMYLSFTEGRYYYKGRISTELLLENKEGLIVTTSCMASKFARLLEEGNEKEAEERILLFKREFGNDFYAELQLNEIPQQKIYNHFILRMIKKHDLCPIITSDTHYAHKEDARLQDVLIAINQKKVVDQPGTFKLEARNLYYPNAGDFHDFNKKFGHNYPEHFVNKCLENTLQIADKCNFEFEMGVEKYPKYIPTDDVVGFFKTSDVKEIITKLSHGKLKQKIKAYKESGVVKIDEDVEKQYKERLDNELKVINDKNMLDYFMIYWELIRHCEKNGVDHGPGRGSACGSLLSYCLDITKIDSLRFKLYFERFLNYSRKGPPDLDLDLSAGSEKVVMDFLYSKYGKERVIPVITFGTFNEKGAIKDVARALGQDAGFDSEVFAVTQEMPKKWVKPYNNLETWLKNYPKSAECSERVRRWLLADANQEIQKLTLKLQGQVRHLGKHAAGVIITPGPVWEYIPVNICKGELVTAFQESGSGKDLSAIGLLKLDLLKLETLNVISDTIKTIVKGKQITEIEIKNKINYVDLNDQELYNELKKYNNQGIFQFESDGINSLINGISIEKFEELVATNALYRPAPMSVDAHDDYIKNKFNPEKATYAHDILKPLLEDTNGVLIFQEQLMFIAHEIGGMTLGEGDNLRKVMDGAGKIILRKLSGEKLTEQEEKDKNYKQYKELWERFLSGAKAKGLKDKEISEIEAWLVKYLGYSFNRCLTKNHTVFHKTKGKIGITDVVVGDEILSYDPINHTNVYNEIKNIHLNGHKDVFRIKTENGKMIEATLDHKLLSEDGMKPLKEIIKNKLKILVC